LAQQDRINTCMNFREFSYKLSRWSPLAWAFILFGVAFILVRIDSGFTRKLAILPLLIGLLLFYQAIFRRKMY
jgi:hypothetical protein